MPKVPVNKRSRSQHKWYLHCSRQNRLKQNGQGPNEQTNENVEAVASLHIPDVELAAPDIRVIVPQGGSDKEPSCSKSDEPVPAPEEDVAPSKPPSEEFDDNDAISLCASDNEI